jgi:ABC-type lipoprotein export system ATPase subunit
MAPEPVSKPGMTPEAKTAPLDPTTESLDSVAVPREDRYTRNGPSSNSHATAQRAVVEVRGLSRTYGSDPPVQALRGVDLTIYAGEWMAIIGPSGSGKSTLLHILGCLDRPSAGVYMIDGINTNLLNDEERATLRARSIGFIFQTFHLLGHRTAIENVMLADVYAGGEREGRRERAKKSLERVGMGHRCDFLPTKLSGGEQQRVAIARALLGSPRLLLCDEPTGNLDTVNTESVLSLFEDLGEDGLTLVVITHDEDVAARAKRVVRIVDGTLNEVLG